MTELDNQMLLDDDLGSETENVALRDLLCDEIRSTGPITFARFMELALYDPREGYYCAPRLQIGAGGDYLTSPEVSPLFGYALARQIVELWRCLGTPRRFDLLEVGAGNATLARDLLRWTAARDPDFHTALQYTIVERSPAMRARQEQALDRSLRDSKLRICATLDNLGKEEVAGCILANELLDSFPVHRVRVEHGSLREIFVDLEDGHLRERTGDLSTPAISDYFERLSLLPGEGCIAEVNLAAPAWVQGAAGVLRRGYVLLLDYGYPAEQLYASWRRGGSLLCFHRHEASDNPYIRLGRQDMTTHIDFTTLIRAAERAGLRRLAFTDQRHLLANLGVGDSVRLDLSRELAVEKFYIRRRAVSDLLDANGLGRIGVLLLGKDVNDGQLSGFR